MYCTQNLGHKIGGAVFMSKLTRKDKIEIYERSKNGETISSLAKSFNVYKSTINYLINDGTVRFFKRSLTTFYIYDVKQDGAELCWLTSFY